MSQLQVNRINDASGGVLAPISSVMRNRIINGAMVIDQRNAGASVSIAAGGGPFTLDRFRSDNSTDGAVTVQRVTDAPTGFVNSMKYTVTTADASLASTQYLGLNHFIEGFNIADLMWGTANAKTITISFWVKSSITGNYPVSLDNNAATRYYVGQYSISSADTWEYKTVTIAGDTSGTWDTGNQRGITVRWFLGSGTGLEGTVNSWQSGTRYSFSGAASVIGTLNATWSITGVQFEVGTQATSFEYRQYTTELQLCQRYLYKISGAPQYTRVATGPAQNTTTSSMTLFMQTPMRTAPSSVTVTGNFGLWSGATIFSVSSLAISTDSTSPFTAVLSAASTGITADRTYQLIGNNDSTAAIAFSAEL
jgi:hypothetical protein